MPLDPSKPLQQAPVKAGTILLEAGAKASMLILVHQGEVVTANRLHRNGIRKFYPLGANTAPTFSSLVVGSDIPVRLIALKDSVISAFPVRGAFSSLILGKLNVGMLAVRSVLNEIVQANQAIQRLSSFMGQIQKVQDNLFIAYYRANPAAFKAEQSAPTSGSVVDPIIPSARVIIQEYQDNGGELPDPLVQAWLEQDHSAILRRSYEFSSEFDEEEFTFIRRLLALPVELQGNIYKADVNILEGLTIRLSRLLDNSLQELYQLQASTDEGMETLCKGDYSLVEKFYLLADSMDQGLAGLPESELNAVLRFLQQSVAALLTSYQQLQGVPFDGVSPALAKIKDRTAKAPAAEVAVQESSSGTSAGIDFQAVRKELQGSASKIIAFSQIAAEEGKKLLADLKTLRAMTNPLDSGGDPRKIRRNASRVYWQVYEKCYFKYREMKGNVPLAVRLMLFYGFFDEEFLTDDQLATLHQLSDSTRAKKEYPIVYALDWVALVGDKKEPPSLDELGLTFFEKLKNEHKDKGWKKESDVGEEFDNFTARVKYEILNYMESNARLTSGSPGTAFPILTKYQITTPLDKCFVTQQKLSEALDKLISIDYSAFHREVLINDEEKGILKEFVMQQVIPYFILVPSIGSKIMMWQDLAGRSKSSRGRLSIPIFATADLYTLLLEAVAAFRWELTKSIMGPDWNNVSAPSLTADYTDYAQFFKRNKDLSPEIKEKLAAEFKRLRTDRDRFTADYVTWVKFESEGSLRLNRVVRGILYRHVSFAKPVREKLAAQPAYTEINNRFQNIRNRKIKELDVKYRKYGETGQIPEILRKNLEYYRV